MHAEHGDLSGAAEVIESVTGQVLQFREQEVALQHEQHDGGEAVVEQQPHEQVQQQVVRPVQHGVRQVEAVHHAELEVNKATQFGLDVGLRENAQIREE